MEVKVGYKVRRVQGVTRVLKQFALALPSVKSLGEVQNSLCRGSNHSLLLCRMLLAESDGGCLTHLHIIPDGKFLPLYCSLAATS